MPDFVSEIHSTITDFVANGQEGLGGAIGEIAANAAVGEGARAAINLLEDLRGADYVDYRKPETEPA